MLVSVGYSVRFARFYVRAHSIGSLESVGTTDKLANLTEYRI